MFASEVVLMAITFTIMAITLSSIYASTDSTAGEKERGTLETILTFPIARKELILGKYFNMHIWYYHHVNRSNLIYNIIILCKK